MRSSFELVEVLEDYLKEKKISCHQFCALVYIPNSTISSWKSQTPHCESGDANEQGF